jgi:hypothetical protein
MNQTSIKSLFTKKSKEEAIVANTERATEPINPIKKTVLTSTDEQIMKYYETLTPSQRIAHEIAVTKLGTSYDVSRTHGYLAWLKSLSGSK